MKSKQFLFEVVGWYGAFAIVSAYALASFEWLSIQNPWYQILNGTGAIGIVLNSLSRKAYPPAVLNIIWTVIAVVALARIFL